MKHRFPPLTPQSEIQRQVDRKRAQEFIGDCIGVVSLVVIALGVLWAMAGAF